MSLSSLLKELFQVIIGGAIEGLKESIREIITEAQEKLEIMITDFTKSFILFSIAFIGLIFSLVGLAMLLNSRVPVLAGGGGYVVVGGILFLLALFAGAMRK